MPPARRSLRSLVAMLTIAAVHSLCTVSAAGEPTPMERATAAFAAGDYAGAEKAAGSVTGAARLNALLLKARAQLLIVVGKRDEAREYATFVRRTSPKAPKP